MPTIGKRLRNRHLYWTQYYTLVGLFREQFGNSCLKIDIHTLLPIKSILSSLLNRYTCMFLQRYVSTHTRVYIIYYYQR